MGVWMRECAVKDVLISDARGCEGVCDGGTRCNHRTHSHFLVLSGEAQV